MICALIDRLLVATGYEVNWVTPLPPLYALPKTLQSFFAGLDEDKVQASVA